MLIYTDLVHEIVRDVAARVPRLAHVDPDNVAVAAAARWAGQSWGNLATCIGLADESEPLFSVWSVGRTKRIVEVSPWYRHRPVEIVFGQARRRYLILLRLPRFWEHNPLETIVHEMVHIGEEGDGRLRPLRHGRLFDWHVRRCMREWLAVADPGLARLAQMKLPELQARFGAVLARRLPGRFRPTLTVEAEPASSYEEAVALHFPGYRLAPGYRRRAIRLDSGRAPRRITETECTLRNYHAGGAEDVPPAMARYLCARPQPNGARA